MLQSDWLRLATGNLALNNKDNTAFISRTLEILEKNYIEALEIVSGANIFFFWKPGKIFTGNHRPTDP